MLTARAFCSARRSAGLPSGLVPLLLTAIAMSLPILVNCFATRSMRAKMVCLRFSKARPMPYPTMSGRREARSWLLRRDPRPHLLGRLLDHPPAVRVAVHDRRHEVLGLLERDVRRQRRDLGIDVAFDHDRAIR